MAERLVRDLTTEEALQEEIKNTLGRNNQSYGEWCAQTDNEKNNIKVKLTITYIIRASSKGIIGMVLYSKAFQKCDAAKKRRE